MSAATITSNGFFLFFSINNAARNFSLPSGLNMPSRSGTTADTEANKIPCRFLVTGKSGFMLEAGATNCTTSWVKTGLVE